MNDEQFIVEGLTRGLFKKEHILQALAAQQELVQHNVKIPIWDVFVRKKFITRDQTDGLLSAAKVEEGFPFGGYRVMKKLGEGGMGIVYLAIVPGSNAQVALKVLPKRFAHDRKAVKRFRREAQLAIQLDHPNLVCGTDFGTVGDRIYYAMEYVEGEGLDELIKRNGSFIEKAALDMTKQITSALDAIHRARLVHRDVKPGNILVSPDGTPRLTDLGLAQLSGSLYSHLTSSGVAVGTPCYMAPEQIEGSRGIDIRADIYGLGATLYHMVTGEQPFQGHNPLEILHKQLSHQLEDPRHFAPELSNGICHVIEKSMARRAADRYETPAVMLRDITHVAEGRAPTTSPVQVGRSVVRHHRFDRVARVTNRTQRPPGLWDSVGAVMPWFASVILIGGMLSLVVYMLVLIWPRGEDTGPSTAGLPDGTRIEPNPTPKHTEKPPPAQPKPLPEVIEPPEEPEPGYLGLVTKMSREYGVLVEHIVADSPAQKAGLLKGDMIYSINGGPVHNPRQVIRIIRNCRSGDDVVIVYYRDGERAQVCVRLE